MNPILFYQQHLNKVSRSFAFCIECLDEDLRLWVSISYLLCRLLDTVEDAPWRDQNLKFLAFENFQSFLKSPPDSKQVLAWHALFPKDIPNEEYALLNDACLIFEDFHSLPLNIQNKIGRGVLNMSRGMLHFAEPSEAELKSLAEVNQYCFFVAGVVGEILTDLLNEKISFIKDQNIYLLSHHFGIFLQKINLLKDQIGDEKEGRFLIHSRAQVLASLAVDARAALEYLKSIPTTAVGYRLFCAWSLFLGIHSLPWIQRSWALKVIDKIPRAVTQKILAEVQAIISDNEALEQLFNENFSIESAPSQEIGTQDLSWLSEAYDRKLDQNHLLDLGMLSMK